MHSGPVRFLHSLSEAELASLFALKAQARQAPPAHRLRWRCGSQPLGLLDAQRAAWLTQHLSGCSWDSQQLVWHAELLDEAQRSETLQAVLLSARDQGLLSGWRNERFSFWHAGCDMPELQIPAFFSVERSGFRWLGLRSHAVHVNGFLSDGRLWCARRAWNKATDPGMLDNITAGGLPCGESIHDCLLRELAEEAGLFNLPAQGVQAAGSVGTARLEPQGWHDEVLHVFNLTLDDGFVPANQDGEVAEFICLRPHQVLEEIRSGAFTADAVQSLLQGLRHCV